MQSQLLYHVTLLVSRGLFCPAAIIKASMWMSACLLSWACTLFSPHQTACNKSPWYDIASAFWWETRPDHQLIWSLLHLLFRPPCLFRWDEFINLLPEKAWAANLDTTAGVTSCGYILYGMLTNAAANRVPTLPHGHWQSLTVLLVSTVQHWRCENNLWLVLQFWPPCTCYFVVSIITWDEGRGIVNALN